jgi:hypothetical protein
VADSSSTLPALRQLLRERFPTAVRITGTALTTGIPAIDEAGGGLPRPALTEIVCSAASCGSQLLLGQLLQVTRNDALRVALVDAADAFDPGSWPVHLLEHLVWIRARHTMEAMSATDLLARDANFGLVMLDLRQAPRSELRRVPPTHWYRVQRALEPTTVACVVFTPCPVIPSAQLRLQLTETHRLADQSIPRPELTLALSPALLRQRQASHLEATG